MEVIYERGLRILQKQFVALEKVQANNKLPAKAMAAAVRISKLLINRQIDLLIKEIQRTTGKGLEDKTAWLLINSLERLKLK